MLGQLTDRLKAVEPVDLEAFLQQCPDYAAELRQIFPAMLVLADLDGAASMLTDDGAPAVVDIDPVRGVLGDYRIVRQIGRGGMGVVFEAEQISLGRTVALKVLPFAAVLDDRQIKRFKNEARAAAMLNHPNIVPVYSVGTERGVHYYAMQLVEGNTLAEVIEDLHGLTAKDVSDGDVGAETRGETESEVSQKGSATLREIQFVLATDRSIRSTAFFRSVACIGMQAADALEHAHAHGVLHRDIKPSNLMIDSKGNLFITDFGLARLDSEQTLTASGDVMGTLQFMSPEQTLGKPTAIDHRTDIYSLGASLYKLMTLTRVFAGTDREELLRQILTDEPARPRRLNDAIPRELELIVLKAMSKNRDARYESAGELADDLRCYLNHRPIRATAPTLAQLAGKWCWRHQTLTAAISATLIVALIVGTLMTLLALHRETGLLRQAKVAQRQAELTALQARRMGYASDISLASRAWLARDVPQFLELLDRHIPARGEADVRGFEWYYLRRWSHPHHDNITVHQGAAYTVCCSPDGRWLVTAGAASVVRIFETKTWRLHATIATAQGEINGVAFDPESRIIATAGDDGSVCLWNLDTRTLIRRIAIDRGEAYQALFTPDGLKLITCGNDPIIRIWDARTGKQCGEMKGHTRAVEAIVISRDGNLLASAGSDDALITWDLNTQSITSNHRPHGGRLSSVALSPDGKWLVTGSIDQSFVLWDFARREPVRQVFGVDAIQCVNFSPDGQFFAVGDRGGTIHLWRRTKPPAWSAAGSDVVQETTDSIEHVGMFHAHQGRVYAVEFMPDSHQLASVGQDGNVRIWPVTPAPDETPIEIDEDIEDIAFVAGGNQLAAATLTAVHLIDAASGRVQTKLPAMTNGWRRLAASPRGLCLVATNGHGSVRVWNCTTGTARICSDLDQREPVGAAALALSDDERFLAVGTWHHPADTVSVFDILTGERRHVFSAETAWALAFSPDGRLLAAGSQNEVFVWDLTTNRRVHVLRGHANTIRAIAFSPDGSLIATASNDRRIILWDTATGAVRFTLRGHRDQVWSVAFSPDGRSLATAGADGALIIWHVATGRQLLELVHLPYAIHKAVFSHDGQYLAYRGYDTRTTLIQLAVPESPNGGAERP